MHLFDMRNNLERCCGGAWRESLPSSTLTQLENVCPSTDFTHQTKASILQMQILVPLCHTVQHVFDYKIR